MEPIYGRKPLSIFLTIFPIDILNEEPGSETASLLDVDRRKTPDQNMEYEDDFTDAEMSSVMTEGDLKKVSITFLLSCFAFGCQCANRRSSNDISVFTHMDHP